MLNQNDQKMAFHEADSEWLRSFSLQGAKCLIVCRGPVRKEAFDIFGQIGISESGILLSEKDSVVYPRSLAPELRSIPWVQNVHRVPDYMGVGQQEKMERIDQILEVAMAHGYNHIFAGYGFMAEDADFIEAIENAGLTFVGPSSEVCRRAGAKDEAKKLARSLGNAVIPGVDNISAISLAKSAGGQKALEKLAKDRSLAYSYDSDLDLEENAELLLQLGYRELIEFVTIEELQAAAHEICETMWNEYPEHRIRFKYIGGGGGKGQRVVERPEDVAAGVMDILVESKVTEPGSNRNFLVELNIERTRHNEIQLIGNGDWCVSLGGRDCSVQMHEQKLLEVSLTQELLKGELAKQAGVAAATTKGDLETLARMETESERFGAATGLDSVSTFECIVDGFNHFFMEMNTRIQVEHGVTELAYRLKFTNPDDPNEHFHVEELIEAMMMLAMHGDRLPCPERVERNRSGIEVRINATNDALQPHAGGLIKGWSAPLPNETRFDQGIGTRNPDTGAFVFYNLAGAYDSNIALVLTPGEDRADNMAKMSEILRRTELRGEDLHTNMAVHYGLLNWFIGKEAMAKPDTRFMTSYLAAIGSLQALVNNIDLDIAAIRLLEGMKDREAAAVFRQKQTLLLRPLGRLLGSPHALGGFLGRFDGDLWLRDGDDLRFNANPMRFLHELYLYLNIENANNKPPSEIIWEHDEEIVENALAFYAEIIALTGVTDWEETQELFEAESNDTVGKGNDEFWRACCAAHRGFQAGMEILLLIPQLGIRSGFSEIEVAENLEVVFPEKFSNMDSATELCRVLAPPPKASPDEIVSPMGGAFYARDAPHLPLLIDVGDHFEEGQPLFIIEVMKMFNKVLAPCAGTLTDNWMADQDGSIVSKGQVIFKIEPDERVVEESEADIKKRKTEFTNSLLG